MELKFIWIDEYRIIKQTGFNFNHSGKHQFYYDGEKMELLPNEKGPIDFGPHILGVTAIAGQNGSGKSSLCEISLLTTATWTEGIFGYDIRFKGIVCYGDYIFFHEDLVIKNLGSVGIQGNYKLVSFKESPFEEMEEEWRESFLQGGFIYYSNVIDLRSHFYAVNLSNISTQSLISEDHRYSPYNSNLYIPKHMEYGIDRFSLASIYYREQAYRFTKFYLQKPKFIPFSEPEGFVISSMYSGNNRYLNLDVFENHEDKKPFIDIEESIFDGICKKHYSSRDHELEITLDTERVKIAIHQLYKLNLIMAFAIINKKPVTKETLYNFVFRNIIARRLFENRAEVIKLIEVHRKLVNSSSLYVTKFRPYSTMINREDVKDWRISILENVELLNTKANFELLKRFIYLEESLLQFMDKSYRRLSSYSIYPELSSGETSFYTFFSRLYEKLNNYKRSRNPKKNILIFIDEAEIGFHPEWNKRYFKWIIDFLNSLGSDFNYQLIFTTHSPYLLSDLPSQNVLLLEKSREGKTEVVPSENYKSFASNIHELLATNFFMKEGFMGEFAKSKIEELIEYLKKPSQAFTPASALAIISEVGDHLIASRLMDMYKEQFEQKNLAETEDDYKQWLESELSRISLKDQS